MNQNKETPRKAYIRHLKEIANGIDLEADHNAVYCGELIKEGYLTGQAVPNREGNIRGAAITGITVKGRLFLQELQKEEIESSWWRRYRNYFFIAGGYILGVLSPILTDLARKIFNLNV